MATGTASGGRRLPRDSAVFTTFPDLLFIFEFVSGGLVWILILLAQVPVPLAQGWVLFVSVSCFVATTLLVFLYTAGAHKNWNFWITLDTAYHCLAALFYFSASALETLVTIGLQDDIYKHYSENISAVVFSVIVTLLYVVHAVFSLINARFPTGTENIPCNTDSGP